MITLVGGNLTKSVVDCVRIIERNYEQMESLNGSMYTYDSILAILGLVTALVLVVVLVMKEVFRARGGQTGVTRMHFLTILSIPLMAMFAAILVFQVLRFLE